MKKSIITLSVISAAMLACVSCSNDIETPASPDDTFTLTFNAEVSEPSTKASLTTSDEKTFSASWKDGDEMTVSIGGKSYIASWSETGHSFSIENVPNDYLGKTIDVIASYPATTPSEPVRTQVGASYNSLYDTMIGSCPVSISAEGKTIIPMTRTTAILYFHVSGGSSEDSLESATLTVGDQTINASYTGQTADDAYLWFNIEPVEDAPVTLVMRSTSGATATISRKTNATYEAAQLYTVIKTVSWEESTSYSIVFKGTDGDSDGSTPQTTIDGIVSSGMELISSISADKVYNAKNSSGIKLGSSKSNGSLLINLKASVRASKLEITAAPYSSSEGDFTINNNDISTIGSSSEYSKHIVELDGSEISSIEIISEKRVYIQSITIYGSNTNTTPTKRTLSSVTVSGTPSKTNYVDGDVFEFDGLTVEGLFSDNTTETITEGISWTTNPSGVLKAGMTSVSVIASINGISSEPLLINNLKVIPNIGENDILLKDWLTFFNTDQDGSKNIPNNTIVFEGTTADGLTISINSGTSINSYIKENDLRCYNGYKITITAPSGKNITSIHTYVGGKTFAEGDIEASGSGEFSESIQTNEYIWSGKQKRVVLVCSATVSFSSIVVSLGEGSEDNGFDYTTTKTVTYKIESTSKVSTSGVAPMASSASYSSTYSSKEQLTAGNSMTLRLSGFGLRKITGLSLSMKSNSKTGGGYMIFKSGDAILAAIGSSSAGVPFNDSKWNGSYTTTYSPIGISLSSTEYIVAEGEDLILTIGATTNSLYCESITIEYCE